MSWVLLASRFFLSLMLNWPLVVNSGSCTFQFHPCFWNAVLVESFSFDFATAYELSCIYSYSAPVYQEIMWNFFFYKYDTKQTDCYYVIYFPAQQGAVPGIVISSCWPSESVYPCFSGWHGWITARKLQVQFTFGQLPTLNCPIECGSLLPCNKLATCPGFNPALYMEYN